MYQDIFFDFGGTIADTSEGIAHSMNYALDRLGIERIAEIEIRKNIGPPLKEIFRKLLRTDSEEYLDKAVGYFRERYSQTGWQEMKLFDGMKEVLRSLSVTKRLYIVTLKPQKFVDAIVDRLQIRPYFRDVLGDDLTSRTENKVMFIRRMIERYDLDTQESVMIGDRAEDCISAKANGLFSIGVTYGFDTVENLRSCGNDLLVDRPEELVSLLCEHSGDKRS